jgi:5'-nucleotidase
MPAAPVQGEETAWVVLVLMGDTKGQLEPFTVKTKKGNRLVEQEMGGYPRLAWTAAQAREHSPGACLVLSSGDDLAGLFYKEFGGQPLCRALDILGLDAATPGNHPFDLGDAYFARALEHCDFPFLAANLDTDANTPLDGRFRDHVVFTRNGVRIGVFGLVPKRLRLVSNAGPGLEPTGDYLAVSRAQVRELREKQGADIVVCLAHLEPEDARRLAAGVPGVDVIVQGNSTGATPRGREAVANRAGETTLLVMPGLRGGHLGLLRLKVSRGRVVSHHWRPVAMDPSVPEDEEMRELVASYRAKLPEAVVLARIPEPLDLRKSTLRTGEARAGGLVADALRQRFKTDIALVNGGGIRGDTVIGPGELTSLHLDMMHPFGNTVSVLETSGAVILQALERGVSQLPQANGCFLQVSGIRYTADITRRPQVLGFGANGMVSGVKSRGRRVVEATVSGTSPQQPLDPGRTYSVAVPDFLARGGDGYFMFQGLGARHTDQTIRDVVADHLRAAGTAWPLNTGRITILGR